MFLSCKYTANVSFNFRFYMVILAFRFYFVQDFQFYSYLCTVNRFSRPILTYILALHPRITTSTIASLILQSWSVCP